MEVKGLKDAVQEIEVLSGEITQLTFVTNPQNIVANHPSNQIIIEARNKMGAPALAKQDMFISLSSTSKHGTFSINGEDITSVILKKNENRITFIQILFREHVVRFCW